VMPTLVDRVGAPVLGLGTGFIVAGMIALVFQLLPFHAALLGFQRITAAHNEEAVSATLPFQQVPMGTDVEFSRHSLWLSPDGLTVALASKLSQDVFATEPSFAEVHPDLLEELHWRRFGTQRESRDWVAPDSLNVLSAKVLSDNELWVYKPPDPSVSGGSSTPVATTTRPPGDGDHYVAVVVTLSSDKDKTTDNDGTHRFRGGQFRLVARDPRTGETEHFPMVGICYQPNVTMGEAGKWQYFHPFRGTIVRELGDGLGIAFEVPERLEPWFVEYKASARAPVPQIKVSGAPGASSTTGNAARPPMAPPAPAARATEDRVATGPPPVSPSRERAQPVNFRADADEQTPEGTNEGGRDRISARYVRDGVSRFGSKLPVPIERKTLLDQGADLTNEKIEEAHVQLELPESPPEGDVVSEFLVPEGHRLLQLWVDRTEAKSIFGRSIQITREAVGGFTVQDDGGDEYHRIGEVRIADVNGKETLEMQYWPNAEMPERCIREFRTVKKNHMTGEYSLIYLYLIPEGRQPQRFNVGGGKSRPIGEIQND